MDNLLGYDQWLDAPIENDYHQRELDARVDEHEDEEEEEFDPETMCDVFVDLDSRCGKPITTIVEEPWTPGRFQIECCDDCAKGFIDQGYHNRGERK